MFNPTERLITAEEFYWEKNQKHAELVRGVLCVRGPPGVMHGYFATRISYLLMEHVQRHRLGAVLIETGYILRRNPDVVRAPDVSFISAARLPSNELPVAFFPGAPDLAVEVLSPDDRWRDIEEKLADYSAGGVRRVWLVDPLERRVGVWYPNGTAKVLAAGDVLDGEDVLPGFRCAVGEVFRMW